MSVILLGLATNILTWFGNKLKLSNAWIAMIVSFAVGSIYFIATHYYAVQWKIFVAFILGIYATSQLVYNILQQRGILDKINTLNTPPSFPLDTPPAVDTTDTTLPDTPQA